MFNTVVTRSDQLRIELCFRKLHANNRDYQNYVPLKYRRKYFKILKRIATKYKVAEYFRWSDFYDADVWEDSLDFISLVERVRPASE